MTQFVSMRVEIGQSEFRSIFTQMTTEDSSIPRAIGAPCAFVFSPGGKAVYCGPSRNNGLSIDKEFKDILVKAIKTAGTIRPVSAAASIPDDELEPIVAQLKEFKKQKEVFAGAQILAKFLSTPDDEDQEEISRLQELTGLEVGPPSIGKRLDPYLSTMTREFQRRLKKINDIVSKSENENDFAIAAVKLAELELATKALEFTAGPIASAWTSITKDYPTIRESAAQAAQKGTPNLVEEQRTWTTKTGTFSVDATLISFDGVTAKLEKKDGKSIDVKAELLSKDDVEYLNGGLNDGKY